MYDATGDLKAATDANGGVTRFDSGRLTLRRDGLGNETLYGYDQAGNITSVTSARGNVTRLA
ncbi:MAG: hypothetical protein ACM3ZA_01570 [Bacillota bacterium]